MSDDDFDQSLRDELGEQITAALRLRSRAGKPAPAPIALRPRAHGQHARRRLLAAAIIMVILGGAVAVVADRSRHTARPVGPTDTTTPSTSTSTPALAPVTAEQLLGAPVPSLCGHPAGRLENGTLPGIDPNAGFVAIGRGLAVPIAPTDSNAQDVAIGDIDRDGVADGVAVVGCSPGGNAGETHAFAWGPGPRLIGPIPFEGGAANNGYWPSAVASVAIVDGVIELRGYGWREGDCHACASLRISRSVAMRGDGTFVTDRTDYLGHNISTDGVGPVHAGMTFADVARATNSPVEVSDPNGGSNAGAACVYVTIWGTDRISGTGGNGVLGALYLDQPAYRTDSGVGPGSTIADVENAYPGQITRRPNMYRSHDDLYVGSTGTDGAALRFVLDVETGTRVDEVIVGNQPAVGYPEGCS